MAVISAFSKCLVSPTGDVIPPPPTALKNWNPGNYIEGDSDAQWNAIKTRLSAANDPNGHYKGAMMRISWRDMESTNAAGNGSGGYAGMDKVQNWLDQTAVLRPDNACHLMVFLQMKTFGATSYAVPNYMMNNMLLYGDGSGYSGARSGQFAYASSNGGDGGFFPNMHVPAVAARFDALIQAFADRFNDNPYLEAFVITEASIAQPVGSPTNWPDEDDCFNGIKSSLITARSVLSNIQICQWVNAPRDKMENFVPDLRAAGVGIGMTDLCPEDEGFNYRSDIPGDNNPRGNIEWCQLHAGHAMVMGHASKQAYNGTVAKRSQVSGTIQGQPHVYPTYPGLGPTRQAIRDFAVNEVGCTHLVWIHNTGPHPATGAEDPQAPASANPYTATSDSYSGTYVGKSFNTVTDNYIHGSSNIGTVTTRPTGWD